MVYADPAMAREILRYSVSLQSRASGEIPYGSLPLCRPYDLIENSDDLDFWLLMAAAEYGLGSRDTRFFSEKLPFNDSDRRVSVWRHLKIAFAHQESLRGPHGGYLAGRNGDWSDFSAVFLHMNESMLVPAQLAYAYPRLAELAELRGDRAFAAKLRARAAELRATVRRRVDRRLVLARLYRSRHPDRERRDLRRAAAMGDPRGGAEPLAGADPGRQHPPLPHRDRRAGGARWTGARSALPSPPPRPIPRSPSPRPPAASTAPPSTWAGVWYDVNGWLTWALASLDGTVPGAARYAWSEYTRNTLAAHATAFPRHWDGTISVDDACNAFYASRPAELRGRPLLRLRGSDHRAADLDGDGRRQPRRRHRDRARFPDHPHLRRFSLRLPRVGVERDGSRIRGYLRVASHDRLALGVGGVPRGAAVTVWADGRRVAHRRAGGLVHFHLDAQPGRAADWAVTWR